MRPIKWIRKNRNKLMAGFVVVIMGAFILGDMTCKQLANIRRDPTLAYFGEDGKISAMGREEARQELIVLRSFFAPEFLASQQDVNIQLLGQVLFFEPGLAEKVSQSLKGAFASAMVPASDAQVDDFFRQLRTDADPADLWILLNAEADRAGVASSNDEAAQILSQVIPQLIKAPFRDYLSYQMSKGISEEKALSTYSKMIKVFRYAQLKTAQELVTTSQLKSLVRNRMESVDPNVVRIDAAVFADANAIFPQEQLARQFETFKDYFQGDYTDDNPYGFGYRLPSRVQLEYIAVKMDDVSKAVAKPGVEEMQAYYQQNTDRFTELLPNPADPNNPENSISRVRPYSEVAEEIGQTLYTQKVQTKANAVLADAERLINRNLEGEFVENLTDARYKELVGSYEDAAKAITEKHGIRLYAGRTGMLSSSDFYFGRRGHTGSLYLEGRTGESIPLRKIAFAVAKLDGVELGPFDIATPRMFETIGPLSDSVLDQVKSLVRVVDAAKDGTPSDLNVSYSIAGIRLDEPVSKEDIHSVKETVRKDLVTLAAMAKAEELANELKSLGAGADWKPTLKKWNDRYGKPSRMEPFTVQPLGAVRRPSAMDTWTETQRLQRSSDFVAEKAVRLKPRLLAARVFNLLPPGQTVVRDLPAAIKFEPSQAYFVIKTMSLGNIATTRDYENSKALGAYYIDVVQGQAFALVHFSPANIKQRMAYRHWQSKELAAAIDAINTGDYAIEVSSGGGYTDQVGGRFSVILAEGLVGESGSEAVTYQVPTATKDGTAIPMSGQRLGQSVVNFRAGGLKINVRVRESYWDKFDYDMESLRNEYDSGADKVDSRLTKVDGARASEIIALDGKKVSIVLFLKKDEHDHLITVTCPADELPARAAAIRGFLASYHSLAPQK